MSLRCIIVDDEPNAVNLLEILIHQTTEWQILGKCYNSLEAIAFLKKSTPDLIFLDINMPQMDGMELATLLSAGVAIVFTTAYSEYAVESYTFSTIDYLLKPITLKRFLTATQKVEAFFAKKTTLTPITPEKEWLFVKSGKVLHKICREDILYVEDEKEYVKLVMNDSQLLVYRRLKDIEAQLPAPFVRVHNSFIVNTRQLEKIQDNHIFIAGRKIPVSEKFKPGLMMIIQQKIF